MNKKTAGIILTSAFVMPGTDTFKEYLDYMERSEATRNEHFDQFNAFSPDNSMDSIAAVEGSNETMFSTYNDYMSNPKKTSALFANNYDQAPEEVIRYMKEYFEMAQENKSPLWQLVFSFRNEWLIENNYLDPETNQLKTQHIYQATRLAIAELEKKEGLKGEWTGAVHYNTDNIHVHVGYVEKNPTREWIFYKHPKEPSKTGWQFKGKFLQKSIKATKRTFVNELMQNKEQLSMLETYVTHQKKLAESCKEQFTQGKYEQLFTDLLQKLPSNQYFWKYGFAERHKFKPELDKIVDLFMETDGKETMDEILPRLQKISDDYEEAYGNPRNEPTYLDKQLYGKSGLYSRIGNMILQEAKNYPELLAKRKTGLMNESDFEQFNFETEIESEGLIEPFDSLEMTMPQEENAEESMIYDDVLPHELLEESHEEVNNIEEQIKVKQSENKMDQALKTLHDYFTEREESKDSRNLKIVDQLKAEKESSKKEIRGMFLHEVEGNQFAEPVSSFTHETLGRKIILPSKNKAHYISIETSKDKEVDSNLQSFSGNNQRAILQQIPTATHVLGEKQWQLNNRQIREDEIENAIKIVTIKKDESGSFVFETKDVYDISQTDKLPKKERNANYKIEKATEKNGQKRVTKVSNRKPVVSHKKSDYEFKKQLRQLRKSCERSVQRYLNEKAYQELEQSMNI
ncbi:relaxase MobL (plasmid) [Enterococcus faecalis]|nr:relaxase MobL [Enterococcus faecalis]